MDEWRDYKMDEQDEQDEQESAPSGISELTEEAVDKVASAYRVDFTSLAEQGREIYKEFDKARTALKRGVQKRLAVKKMDEQLANLQSAGEAALFLNDPDFAGEETDVLLTFSKFRKGICKEESLYKKIVLASKKYVEQKPETAGEEFAGLVERYFVAQAALTRYVFDTHYRYFMKLCKKCYRTNYIDEEELGQMFAINILDNAWNFSLEDGGTYSYFVTCAVKESFREAYRRGNGYSNSRPRSKINTALTQTGQATLEKRNAQITNITGIALLAGCSVQTVKAEIEKCNNPITFVPFEENIEEIEHNSPFFQTPERVFLEKEKRESVYKIYKELTFCEQYILGAKSDDVPDREILLMIKANPELREKFAKEIPGALSGKKIRAFYNQLRASMRTTTETKQFEEDFSIIEDYSVSDFSDLLEASDSWEL